MSLVVGCISVTQVMHGFPCPSNHATSTPHHQHEQLHKPDPLEYENVFACSHTTSASIYTRSPAGIARVLACSHTPFAI